MSVTYDEFFALEEQFQKIKKSAEQTKIKVIKVYKLVPYEYGGAQGTCFEPVGTMYFQDYHEAFKTQLDTINENLASLDKDHSKGIYLLVERLYSAAGSYYYPDGTIVKYKPSEGYLRVPANNVWVYVNKVKGGIESFPASASSKSSKPEGWNGCKNKYDIEVEWAGEVASP